MSFSHLESLFVSATALAEASTVNTTYGTRQADTMLSMMPSPHSPPHARRASSIDQGSFRSERADSTSSQSSHGARSRSRDGSFSEPIMRRVSGASDASLDSNEHSVGSLDTLDEEEEYNLAPPEELESLNKTESRSSKLLGKIKGLKHRKFRKSSIASTSSSSSKKSRSIDDDDDRSPSDKEYRQRTGYDFLTMGYVPGAYMGIW